MMPLIGFVLMFLSSVVHAVGYDIVYVRAPRVSPINPAKFGLMPEVKDPINAEPGSDLMLLRPDGSEEVLVSAGDGAVADPCVSFDGRSVYYSLYENVLSRNSARNSAPFSGADIYRMNLDTREVTRLTFQEFTPSGGVATWTTNPRITNPLSGQTSLGYGIFNLGACPVSNGRVVFTSNRNGYLPNKAFTFPNLQLFVMDEDGKNVTPIGHLSLGSALHPVQLLDGRIMFSSYESQGLRDRRVWGLWAINPDGRDWQPLLSAMQAPEAIHWQTQSSDGAIAVIAYYNQNNNGFGTLLRLDSVPGLFGSPTPSHPTNPVLQTGWRPNGNPWPFQIAFSPPGLDVLTRFAWARDADAPVEPATGLPGGKVTQPSAAPDNDLLIVYSPGTANNNGPTPPDEYDAGLYVLPGSRPVSRSSELTLIKNHPSWNEQQPRAVVSYQDIYGVPRPDVPASEPPHPHLPEGTPFGLVGTSSFYKRDTTPGTGIARFDGLDPFNSTTTSPGSNWIYQGADAGRYSNSDIYAVRVLAMKPTSHLSYGPVSFTGRSNQWRNAANERLSILGEVLLRKRDAQGNLVLDPEGNPDTSFLARIPAGVPYTFQTLDQNGLVLNMSQTWHQSMPGEFRADCGGCHAHSQVPLLFEASAAGQPDFQPTDLAVTTPLMDGQGGVTTTANGKPLDVEFHRDIRPILDQSCVQCHTGAGAPAGLVLDDRALNGGIEGTWYRLAQDQAATWGRKPLIGTWRNNNLSRYVRAFQARRSLLTWQVFGARLDGWTNTSHPTESVPGNASTLPPGANRNDADLDWNGVKCPPPGSGVPPLTPWQQLTIARWIDLGAPATRLNADSRAGWFADEFRPVVSLEIPPSRLRFSFPLRIGVFDLEGPVGVSVTADHEVGGRPPGEELSDLLGLVGDYIWELPTHPAPGQTVTVRAADVAGNVTVVEKRF